MAESLSLLGTIKAAADLIWKNRVGVGQVVILAALVKSTMTWLVFEMLDPLKAAWLYSFVSVIVYTLLGINVHRLLLIAKNPLVFSRWSFRETRFLGWLILIYIYFALIFAGLGLAILPLSGTIEIPEGGWFVALIFFPLSLPGAYLCARLAMLLPATAVDKRQDMGWVWALTQGNGWRLVALLWLLPFSYSYLMPEWSIETPFVYLLAHIAVSAATAFEVALLSAAFKTLGGLTYDRPPQELAQNP